MPEVTPVEIRAADARSAQEPTEATQEQLNATPERRWNLRSSGRGGCQTPTAEAPGILGSSPLAHSTWVLQRLPKRQAEPVQPAIAEWLEKDPTARAAGAARRTSTVAGPMPSAPEPTSTSAAYYDGIRISGSWGYAPSQGSGTGSVVYSPSEGLAVFHLPMLYGYPIKQVAVVARFGEVGVGGIAYDPVPEPQF
jgi:hypothetical protein